MHRLSFFRLQGGVLAVLAVALVWAACREHPEGASHGGEIAALLEAEQASAQQRQQEDAGKVLVWSAATRWAIAAEVRAGRLTLLEGAAGFRAIDGIKARYALVVPGSVPGESDEERLCRQVILYVVSLVEGEEVVGRLERELREQLRQQGKLQLPQFRRPEHLAWFEP
jgi:hypothetical protein